MRDSFAVFTYDLAIIAEVQIQDASTVIRRTLQLIERELPELRLGAVGRCCRRGGRGRGRGKATAIVQEESTIYMHNQLTLSALVQAAEREFALQIHRLMRALDESTRPCGHVSMRLRAQPVDKDSARSAAAHTEYGRLLALPWRNGEEIGLYICKKHFIHSSCLLTFREELLPAPARRVVASA